MVIKFTHIITINLDISLQYNNIGQNYIEGQSAFFSKREDQAINFIIESIGEVNDKVIILDAGCGNGKDIVRLQSMGYKNLFGIDSSDFMIEKAKKNIANPENIILGNMEKTDFQPNMFDIIVGRFSIHYLNDFNTVYKEFNRILKPGGKFIFVVHHPMKDMVYKKEKHYAVKENITMHLYKNLTPITFPTHTFKEHLSEAFFKYFYLDSFEEEQSPEEYLDSSQVPGFMGLCVIKRSSFH